MNISLSGLKPEDVKVFDNGWGAAKPEGITIGNVDIWLSDKVLDALSVVVTMLVTERAIADAERERDETRECEAGDVAPDEVAYREWMAS